MVNIIGYVYITTNLINNKKYIGLKTSDIFQKSYLGSGKILKKAVKKYGKTNFTVELLEKCETIEDLKSCERKWIKEFNAQEDENFYNIAEGGQWGNNIKGMSKQEKENYCKKLSTSIKESYNKIPNLRELRAINFSKCNEGRKHKLCEIEKARQLMKKRWEDNYEEMVKIIRENIKLNKEKGVYKNLWKNHKHPWIGRKHTEEAKKKISENTNNEGVNNPNCKNGKILFKEKPIFEFDLTQQAHVFLEEKGFSRRKRYRLLKGEIIDNYEILRN